MIFISQIIRFNSCYFGPQAWTSPYTHDSTLYLPNVRFYCQNVQFNVFFFTDWGRTWQQRTSHAGVWLRGGNKLCSHPGIGGGGGQQSVEHVRHWNMKKKRTASGLPLNHLQTEAAFLFPFSFCFLRILALLSFSSTPHKCCQQCNHPTEMWSIYVRLECSIGGKYRW